MKTRISGALALALLCLALGARAHAASDEHRGTVKGENTKSYTVTVADGQTLELSIKTKSSFVHFNVTQVGAKEPLWKGETQGDKFAEKFEKAGVYRVDVFLSEAEAKRGGQASFTLTVASEP